MTLKLADINGLLQFYSVSKQIDISEQQAKLILDAINYYIEEAGQESVIRRLNLYNYDMLIPYLNAAVFQHPWRFEFESASEFIERNPNFLQPEFTHIQSQWLEQQSHAREHAYANDVTIFLQAADCAHHVSVSPSNRQEILRHIKSAQAYEEPYKISFMLNYGDEPLWYAAQLLIDPQGKTVSYITYNTMVEGLHVPAEVKSELAFAVSDAFPNQEGWSFTKGLDSQTTSHAEGYASAMRGLHALFQDPGIHENKQMPVEFAALPTDGDTLYAYFSRVLLTEMRVSRDYRETLNSRTLEDFEGDRIDPQRISDVVASLLPEFEDIEDPIQFKIDTPDVKSAVSDVVSEITATARVASFPNYAENIDGRDTDIFMRMLGEKLDRLDMHLPVLDIDSASFDILGGLHTYYADPSASHRIDKITLTLTENPPALSRRLKTLLLNASKHAVAELVIDDSNAPLSIEQWEALAEFVEHNAVSTRLVIRRFFVNDLDENLNKRLGLVQRRLDQMASINQRQLKIDSLDTKQLEEKATQRKAPKRRRPRISAKAVADIELEQDQELDIAVQTERAREDDVFAPPDDARQDLGNSFPISYDEFIGFVKTQAFPDIEDEHYCISEFHAQQLWNRVTGTVCLDLVIKDYVDRNKAEKPPEKPHATVKIENDEIQFLTKEAIREVLTHQEQFQFGVDTNHLPPGFVVLEHDGMSVLHFEPNACKIQAPDPLAIALTSRHVTPPVAHDVALSIIERINSPSIQAIWETQQQADYQPDEQRILKNHLIKLASLDEKMRAEIVGCCQVDGQFNLQSFNFLMRNSDRINRAFKFGYDANEKGLLVLLNKVFAGRAQAVISIAKTIQENKQNLAEQHLFYQFVDMEGELSEFKPFLDNLSNQDFDALLELYNEFGEKGIHKLFLSWQNLGDDFEFIASVYLNNTKSFTPFINDQFVKSLEIYSALPEAEKIWFAQLAKQHMQTAGFADISDLLKSFSAFQDFIKDKGLSFYEPVSFTNIHNMPVALARMQTILTRCDYRDLETQWKCLSAINLSSDTAIRAMTPQEGIISARIVIPEMNITPERFNQMNQYNTELDYHSIAVGKPSDEKFAESYYRFLACQRHRLPMHFYQAVFEKIHARDFSKEVKQALCACILGATTGAYNMKSCIDPELCLLQVDQICDSLQKIKIIGFSNIARHAVTNTILKLNKSPPLNTMRQLVKLIGGTLKISKDIMKKSEELAEHAEILSQFVGAYGESIYVGMQCYDDADYDEAIRKGESLFFQHIALLHEKGLADIRAEDAKINKKYRNREHVAVISAFGWRHNIQDVLDCEKTVCDECGNARFMDNVISEFYFLCRSIDKGLKPDDLIRLLQGLPAAMTIANSTMLTDENKRELRNYLKREIGHHFPAKFFTDLEKNTLNRGNIKTIEKYFKDEKHQQLVISIAEQFNEPGIQNAINPILLQLYDICHNMSSNDTERFLMIMNNSGVLNKPNSSAEFSELLTSVQEAGSPESLYFFLANPDVADAKDILQKARFYNQTLLPELNANRLALKKDMLLRADIIRPLLITQIAKADSQMLTETIECDFGDQDDIERLRELLAQTKQDIAEGKVVMNDAFTDNFRAYASRLPAFAHVFSELAQHIEDINAQRLDALLDSIDADIFDIKYDEDIIANGLEQLNLAVEHRSDYAGFMVYMTNEINALAKDYPGSKQLLIKMHRHLLQGGTPDKVHQDCKKFREICRGLSEDTVRAICNHFDPDNEETELGIAALFALDDKLRAKPESFRHSILTMVTVLLNNEIPFQLDEVNHLIDSCANPVFGQHLAQQIHKMYAQSPYPSIAQIERWHEAAQNSDDYLQAFNELYQAYEKQPAERELFVDGKPMNGFHMDIAVDKAAHITGYDYTQEELDALQSYHEQAMKMPVAQLCDELKKIKNSEPIDTEKLVAYAAELLYRAKGKTLKPQKLGSSFEINTTQYLAIHSLIKSGDHVTSQIDTGEGKSRIMMISIACQLALGKTVDFVTSDVDLATRDFLEYKSYFELLGYKSNLIHADSPISAYQIGGVNISDAANLSLFRNSARSIGRGNEVIDPNPKNRVLMLDEADKTYFDVADTRFNHSTKGDATIIDMPWVYEGLIDFFAQDDTRKPSTPYEKTIEYLYYEDIDECNRRFMLFMEKRLTKEQFSRLKLVSQQQIEAWHQSAITARGLKLDADFAIIPDTAVQTSKGPIIASDARLTAGGRIQKGAKFSFGVHQCLHARLNRIKQMKLSDIEKQNPPIGREKLIELKQKLDECQNGYFIDDEKQIIYSSSSKGLVDDYQQGTLLAVSGTVGSIIEREEARSLFRGTDKPMQFLEIPRNAGLKREDKPIHLARNEAKQMKAIIEEIMISRQNRQPVLLVCETDEESEKLFKQLQQELAKRRPEAEQNLLQRISSTTTKEAEAIKQAGQPGMVTISTERIGRGTDIKLAEREQGLKVLVTYLPRVRDLKQIIGRAGRAGQYGESRLILNKKRLKKRLGVNKLHKRFYIDHERYIAEQQAFMDRRQQVERVVKNIQLDFRRELTDRIYEHVRPSSKNPENIDKLWQKFMGEADKLWTKHWPKVMEGLDPYCPDLAQIDERLADYRDDINKQWKSMTKKLKRTENAEILQRECPELKLDDIAKELLGDFDVKQQVNLGVKVYDRYDKAHDGRSVLYKRRFEKMRAIFRGERKLFADLRISKKGTGLWFPDLTALFKGQISLGEFLTGKAKPSRSSVVERGEEKVHRQTTHHMTRSQHQARLELFTHKHQNDVNFECQEESYASEVSEEIEENQIKTQLNV